MVVPRQVETQSKFIDVEIKNAAQNYVDTGMIKWHTFHPTIIYVGRRLVEPHGGRTSGSSFYEDHMKWPNIPGV